ncbi:thioredoxin family protein [Nonomuraea sp. KC401]|uniref:thioredoxin family protein n=1 Tax=unclassified Nonomuraea TaxID=2593643 RepID=UPI0010FDE3CC|nr:MULTISPECIES: thioredoxin family protein [unclassified Nonomuraea]NBE99216.1 redoxin domain-containing protein [Nonomuraea sp. K271]TLF63138.1 thioredoxin family protein [Nonomuraea sp. KC401]
MAANSFMVPLGTPAPAFDLTAIDGGSVSLEDLKGSPATLVIFLSNHCPYVRHIEHGIGALAADYDARLSIVAISSNDSVNYPDDDPTHLAEQAERAGFTFPYLLDESQEVAKAYRAACTPDFFLYDAELRLAYRGEFDGSRPGNAERVTGASLRAAIDAVLAGDPVPEEQHPSLGCGIKWKPGNAPA